MFSFSFFLTLPLVSSMIAQSLRVRAMASARLASELRWKSRDPHWRGRFEFFFLRGKKVRELDPKKKKKKRKRQKRERKNSSPSGHIARRWHRR